MIDLWLEASFRPSALYPAGTVLRAPLDWLRQRPWYATKLLYYGRNIRLVTLASITSGAHDPLDN